MVLKCLEIFLARIVDVTLGTIRTVFFVKGKTIEPFIIAFFEVLVWYIVAREAINTDMNMWIVAMFYAAGYATGTFIGSKLSQKLIKEVVGVQIVLKKGSEKLVSKLRKMGYVVSVILLKNDYEGNDKDMLYIQISNRRLKELTNIVNIYDKEAFMVVSETKLVHNGFIK